MLIGFVKVFKSDRCGIETKHYTLMLRLLSCSNQTVAGLKLGNAELAIRIHARSNQTVAGLKRDHRRDLVAVWIVQIRPLRD